jgi:hypothetical protein
VNIVGFEFITAVLMNVALFWYIAPYISSETSAHVWTAGRCILEDGNIQAPTVSTHAYAIRQRAFMKFGIWEV